MPTDVIAPIRVLLVDLNNFSMYPTIAVGYLASILRQEGMQVTVLSPLSFGVPGIVREPPETASRNLARRVNYVLEQTPGALARSARRQVWRYRERASRKYHPRIAEIFGLTQPDQFDIVLVSTYLMYYDVCEEIGRLCEKSGVPLVIGGSYFAEPEVARSWTSITGLTALITGEVELRLRNILQAIVGGDDFACFPGVWTPTQSGPQCPPLQNLDAVPFPDYSDFPWHLYPSRIVPLITGRGCGWGACTFCSDITSTAGRTYRSRSPENVLEEIEFQSTAHAANQFVFTDLKLNSNFEMLETLARRLPKIVGSPKWIASVHIGEPPNGLDRAMLKLMKDSGASRLTTGLESGSERVLQSLAKGTDLSETSRFFRQAHEVGISVRITMIHGSPGETFQDVEESAKFLEAHQQVIDRVSINRFQAMMGPTFLRRYDENRARYPAVIATDRLPRMAYVRTEFLNASALRYVKATQRLLGAVHRINRKQLPEDARTFDGVM